MTLNLALIMTAVRSSDACVDCIPAESQVLSRNAYASRCKPENIYRQCSSGMGI